MCHDHLGEKGSSISYREAARPREAWTQPGTLPASRKLVVQPGFFTSEQGKEPVYRQGIESGEFFLYEAPLSGATGLYPLVHLVQQEIVLESTVHHPPPSPTCRVSGLVPRQPSEGWPELAFAKSPRWESRFFAFQKVSLGIYKYTWPFTLQEEEEQMSSEA